MKVVGIVGSPRKGGNCDVLVNEFLDVVDADTECFFLNDLNIGYCHADQACQKGDCILNDDGNTVIKAMEEADVIVFSSPIYYGQISGQAKTIIDRFYAISQNPDRTFEGKKVVTIFTQAQPKDIFKPYIDSFEMMPFGFLGMKVIANVTAKGSVQCGDKDQLAPYIKELKEVASNL